MGWPSPRDPWQTGKLALNKFITLIPAWLSMQDMFAMRGHEPGKLAN
jgi:hypothetical protein